MSFIIAIIFVTNFSIHEISKALAKECLQKSPPVYLPARTSFSSGILNFKKFEFKNIKFMPQDIIVGDTPHETLLINYPFEVHGNIIVINDGVLFLKNAELTIYGNIYALNIGKILIDSSYIYFPQVHIYQYGFMLVDSSYMEMMDSKIFGNFMPLNMGMIGKAKANWQNNDFSLSFFTTCLFENSELWIYNAQSPGEYIMMDNAKAHFKNIDTLLVWFHLPESSYVNYEFPPIGWIYNFVFDSTLPNISGIGYHVDIDSSFYLMWGLFPSSGCNVIINNSEIRTIGIFFEHQNPYTLRNLINENHYDYFTLPLNDRIFTLNNTYVHTWSIYPQDTAFLELSYSIVGEVLSMENSFVISHNYFLDGSGGHLEASGNSINLVYLASLTCDIISTKYGIQIFAYSSQILGNIWATDSSRLYILQCEYSTEPIAHDASYLFVGKIDYLSSYYAGDTIKIFGDAYADGGPLNPYYNLDHYALYYQSPGDTNWHFIDSSNTEKRHEILGIWNTQGFSPGGYIIKLTLYSNQGDTMECQKWFNLYPVKIKEPKLDISKGKEGNLVYDVSGRKFKNINFQKGIYFIKNKKNTKKFIFLLPGDYFNSK